MKKFYLVVVLIFLILLFGYIMFKSNNYSKPVIKETYSELLGTIYKKNNHDYIIRDNKGVFYSVNLNYEFNIGDNIKILYKDDINNIYKMEILDDENLLYNDNGIFKNYYDLALKKLNSMSLEEKIGQILLARTPEENQLEAIKDYYLGGFILFGRDTYNETKTSLGDKINSYQQAAKIPMIIAVDEEGGSVVRISNNKNLRDSIFLSPQNIYKLSGLDGIKSNTLEMNDLLSSLKINVNLAPVADVSVDPNDFIYQRALGMDANTTASYVETVIKNQGNGISYVLKHFPGYGNNRDTHDNFSVDDRKLEEFQNNDFLPFISGINANAEAMLFSHNIITNIEPYVPASLSRNVHNLARKDLNFTGIIMTDDLDMGAIKKYYSNNAVTEAILAGNDMIILSDYKQAINEIKNSINNKVLTESIINRATVKILAWKYYKNMII